MTVSCPPVSDEDDLELEDGDIVQIFSVKYQISTKAGGLSDHSLPFSLF